MGPRAHGIVGSGAHGPMNTSDHALPQNRRRLYLVGLRIDVIGKSSWSWPERVDPVSLESLLDRPAKGMDYEKLLNRIPTQQTAQQNVARCLMGALSRNIDLQNTALVIDHMSSRATIPRNMMSPCLTASRGASGGHWLLHQGRQMQLHEMALLQGVPLSELEHAIAVMTKAELGRALGNAMSGNVLYRLSVRILAIVHSAEFDDIWEDPCEALFSLLG